MGRKRQKLPFDSRGGVIVVRCEMLKSEAWINLSPQAKVLMSLLQLHWRNDRPIGYGVREAMQKIPCAKGTAQRAFGELQKGGFIELVDESLFNSRTSSKSRTWRITWMPYMDLAPSNEWEKND